MNIIPHTGGVSEWMAFPSLSTVNATAPSVTKPFALINGTAWICSKIVKPRDIIDIIVLQPNLSQKEALSALTGFNHANNHALCKYANAIPTILDSAAINQHSILEKHPRNHRRVSICSQNVEEC